MFESQFGHCANDKHFCSLNSSFEPQLLGCPASNLVTLLTEHFLSYYYYFIFINIYYNYLIKICNSPIPYTFLKINSTTKINCIFIYSNMIVSSCLLKKTGHPKLLKNVTPHSLSIIYYHRTSWLSLMCWNLPSYTAQMYADYMMQYTQVRKCIYSVTTLAHSHLLRLLRI